MVAEVVAGNSGAVALRERKGAGAGRKKLERKRNYRGMATVFKDRDSKSLPLLRITENPERTRGEWRPTGLPPRRPLHA